MNRLIHSLAGLVFLTPILGCDSAAQQRHDAEKAKEEVSKVEQDAKKDVDEAKRKADEKIDEARKKAAEEEAKAQKKEAEVYQTYADKTNKRFTSMDKDIADMKADLQKAEGKAKADGTTTVRDLEMRRANLQKDLDAAKTKTGEELDKAEKSMDDTLDKLEKDIRSAASKVKEAARKT